MATTINESERAQLEGALSSARAELESTLGELRGQLGRSLDWRAFVARHPWGTLGVFALIGLRLGRGRWL